MRRSMIDGAYYIRDENGRWVEVDWYDREDADPPRPSDDVRGWNRSPNDIDNDLE